MSHVGADWDSPVWRPWLTFLSRHRTLVRFDPRGRTHRGLSKNEQTATEALRHLIRSGWGQTSPAFRQPFTSLFLPGGDAAQVQWFHELQRIVATPETAPRIVEACDDIDGTAAVARIWELPETVQPAPPPNEAVQASLTARERQVLALLAEGLTNKQIAGRLKLTPKPVRNDVSLVLSKLGATTRTEAAAITLRSDAANDARDDGAARRRGTLADPPRAAHGCPKRGTVALQMTDGRAQAREGQRDRAHGRRPGRR